MAYYVDSSALVKLVVAEPDTAALRAWIAKQEGEFVSCDVARTELVRAVRRAAPNRARRARQVLDSLTLLHVSTATYEAAARLEPAGLRTLDAIHLSSALELSDDLDGVVTYDDRLGEAADLHGIPVIAPSRRRS